MCMSSFLCTCLAFAFRFSYSWLGTSWLITQHGFSKGKNVNQTPSGNYRSIVLSFIFGKIFGLIIVSHYCVQLCTSDLQFGFKAKRSTNTCTILHKEAVAYYIDNGSSVFCTALDATNSSGSR